MTFFLRKKKKNSHRCQDFELINKQISIPNISDCGFFLADKFTYKREFPVGFP